MISDRTLVRCIAGIYLCLAIFLMVLACAFRNFSLHEQFDNTIYLVGVLFGFIFNVSMSIILLKAVRHNDQYLFFPYIVCSSFHLLVSCVITIVFLVSLVKNVMNGGQLADLYGVCIFSVLSVYWCWSLAMVRRYREEVKKISGDHMLFHNPEFV